MKHLSSVLSLILLLQSFVWAANPRAKIAPEHMESAIIRYNALSQMEKMELFKEALKQRPKSDRDAFEPYLRDLENTEMPKIRSLDGNFTLKLQGETIYFEILNDQEIKYKGQVIDLGHGKFQSGLKQMELLHKPTTTMLDFFVSSAYADSSLSAMLEATVAAAVAASIWHEVQNPHDFTRDCEAYQNVVKQRWSQIDGNELQSRVEETIEGLARWEAKLTCPSENHPQCELVRSHQVCFQELLVSIEHKHSAKVNDTSRNNWKDVDSSKPKKNARPGASAISQ